jgi:transcriptional regulator with XRE-family HTH domain
MISVVERGESSPTAVLLDKLAAGLGVTMAALFEATERAASASGGPVFRRKDQPQWTDPESGYRRRNVSPPDVRQPMQLVEVAFPAGVRVAFETAVRDTRVYQQIWMLEGTMHITLGADRHELQPGDCLAMQLDSPTIFHNPSRKPARYAVVIAVENASRR